MRKAQNMLLGDRATTGLAGAWLASPAWYGHLQAASEVAAMVVPILSALWIGLKVARFVLDWRRGRVAND